MLSSIFLTSLVFLAFPIYQYQDNINYQKFYVLSQLLIIDHVIELNELSLQSNHIHLKLIIYLILQSILFSCYAIFYLLIQHLLHLLNMEVFLNSINMLIQLIINQVNIPILFLVQLFIIKHHSIIFYNIVNVILLSFFTNFLKPLLFIVFVNHLIFISQLRLLFQLPIQLLFFWHLS